MQTCLEELDLWKVMEEDNDCLKIPPWSNSKCKRKKWQRRQRQSRACLHVFHKWS